MESIKQLCGTLDDLHGLEVLFQLLFERYHAKLAWHKPPSKKLIYFVYRKKEDLYKSFQIPKKSKGLREISAPKEPLKRLQKLLAEWLTEIVPAHPNAFGFLPGKNIVGNSRLHVQSAFVLNLDLENFFPSIEAKRVYFQLQKKPIGFSSKLASYITRLCTLNNGLPQGSPASPILSNLICLSLDKRLKGIAENYNVVYSRYADDLTFSSDTPFPDSFIERIDFIIRDEHFTINSKKVRLQKANVSQEVTGLLVNEKTNTPKDYVRQIRAMLSNWEHYGLEKAQQRFEKYHTPKKVGTKPRLENVLGGKLLFYKMVRGESDLLYQKYKSKFDGLLSGQILPRQMMPDNSLQAATETVMHNPRNTVGFLRQFRTVNDSGFRELLHDPDTADFNFLSNLDKVNKAMPTVKEVLTPGMYKKLERFVEVYNRYGRTYFEDTGLLPLRGRQEQTDVRQPEADLMVLNDPLEGYIALEPNGRRIWKNHLGVTLFHKGRSFMIGLSEVLGMDKVLDDVTIEDIMDSDLAKVKSDKAETLLVLPSEAVPKVTPVPLADFFRLVHPSIKDLSAQPEVAVPPSSEVVKAANVFRSQIRVGTDFFHDLILANALKPTVDKLNSLEGVSIEYKPTTEEFALNCSFFTDAWTVRNVFSTLLNELSTSSSFVVPDGNRKIYLSAATDLVPGKGKLFTSNIRVELEAGEIPSPEALDTEPMRRVKHLLTGLADFSVLYKNEGNVLEQNFLSSAWSQPAKASKGIGIAFVLTFYQS